MDVLTQGPFLAGAGASIAGASADWTNPGNITADDGAVATATVPNDLLAATSFGFALPTDRTVYVLGVVVELNDAGDRSFSVQLTKNGTAGVGFVKSTLNMSVTGWQSLGGQEDLWGTTLTAAEVNASTFGVVLSGGTTIDAVRISVFYHAIEARLPLDDHPHPGIRVAALRRA